MKSLIILVFTLTTVFCLPGQELKPRNVVVPAGKPEGRITHGHAAYKGQFPYQVGLDVEHYYKMIWCGGTLINHITIVTAAHCTDGARKVKVILGASEIESPEVTHEVTSDNIVIHEGWNPTTLENDISIVKIPHTDYTENIQPAKLPSRNFADRDFSGELAVASGWGRTSDAAKHMTNKLQYAYFHIISNMECTKRFDFDVRETLICVSTPNNVSPCRGDSGGPLVLRDRTLVGVASFIMESCEVGYPGAFTRITSYLDWILQNSNGSL